ncbi:MAG: hypothetical protein AAFY28_05395 [Actinomycetota bacterium]
MAQLVLLVVAAAWAAVLIPPMLRSRMDNRPNSSVTDFRRQLKTLQSTSTPPRGAIRPIGRPLAPAGRATGRAGNRSGRSQRTHDGAPHHRQASLRSATPPARPTGARPSTPRHRTGGDSNGFRTHGAGTADHHWDHRTTQMQRSRSAPEPRNDSRRRRTNVLFLLVITTACSLFLAATTSSTVLLYVFALSFLALCGYVYLLAQIRQREQSGWHDGWLEQR